MTAANNRFVTVFGGTGFLGRRVVRHIRKHGFSVRIASRHPDRAQGLFALDDAQLQSIEANIHDERSDLFSVGRVSMEVGRAGESILGTSEGYDKIVFV